jgi:hypothetical protein
VTVAAVSAWHERICAELEDARRHVRAFAASLDDDAWAAVPGPGEWSVAECLVHLNLTSRAFLPPLRDAIALAPARAGRVTCRMDPIGALVWLAVTVRISVKTTEAFTPRGPEPRSAVSEEFETLQDELVAVAHGTRGRDLQALRIISPFDGRVRYNPYATLRLLTAHQRLHLRQAEAAARVTRAGGARARH